MIDRLKENWDAIKDTLKENYDISKVSYDTWIVPMEIHNVDNDQVYILADTKGIPPVVLPLMTVVRPLHRASL